MKTIQLHPVSLFVGLAGGVIGLLLMSQSAVSTLPTGRVEVGPHPRDMVQIREGSPYTVPPGKILTVTALGDVRGPGNPPNYVVQLLRNGQDEVRATAGYGLPQVPAATVLELPTGFTARWGDVVEVITVNGSQPSAVAWGYLADR